MIRVVGGGLRGRRITVPPRVRPTTERARRALFDVLGPRVRGARVLDAAAGSGALGIEALSRGAREAVFVESDPRTAGVLRENLRALGLEAASLVIVTTVSSFAARRGLEPPFDVVFHDPPYAPGPDPDLQGLLGCVASGGVLVHERGGTDDPWPGGPEPSDRRAYGDTRFFLYRPARR